MSVSRMDDQNRRWRDGGSGAYCRKPYAFLRLSQLVPWVLRCPPLTGDAQPSLRSGVTRVSGLFAFAIAIGAVLLTVLGAETAFAAPVGATKAEIAARKFASTRYPANRLAPGQERLLKNVRQWQRGGTLLGHVGDLEPAGFVLLRADDELPPVKVYSANGRFDSLPPAFLDVLERELASEQIFLADLRRRSVAIDNTYHGKWQALSAPATSVDSEALQSFAAETPLSAGPLLTTTWNQDDPYNYYAPAASGGPGGQAYAGCVACALAQILRFHCRPVAIASDYTYTDSSGSCRGTHSASDAGLTAYAWTLMPAAIAADSSVAEKQAVGKLLYHAGVTVNMNYEADGSAAGSLSVAKALSNQFNYTCAKWESRGKYSDSQWYSKINADVVAGRPMYYDMSLPSRTSGHALVCDGARNGNEIHLNFGWGGASDAWYDMNNVNGGGITWVDHGAVFLIQPRSGGSPVVRTIAQSGTPSPAVSVLATPDFGVRVYAVEENLPGDLVPQNINENGAWDSLNRKVTWGPFSNHTARILTYEVMGTPGTYAIMGVAIFNDTNVATTGDSEVTIGMGTVATPAFAPDGGSYISAVSVIVSCATTEAAIHYTTNGVDPTESDAMVAAGGTVIVEGSLTLKAMACKTGMNPSAVKVATYDVTPPVWAIVRTISQNGSASPDVSLLVTPSPEVRAYAVEELLPDGLTPLNINENGAWDSVHQKVKWGPFFDSAVRMLSYEVTGADGYYTIDGVGSFDGTSTSTTGDDLATVYYAESSVIRTIANNRTDTPDVTILVTPATPVTVYAVEERLSVGLTPTNINENGAWDSVHQKVKWGPFFDHVARSLTYEMIGADAVYSLAGVGSCDGVSEATVGDKIVIVGDGDLHLSGLRRTAQGGCRLTWSSAIGRQYRVEKCSNLVEAVWIPVDTFLSTPPENEFILDMGPERCLLFRVLSWKP